MRIRLLQRCLAAVGFTFSAALAHGAGITQVSYDTLVGLTEISFNGLACPSGDLPPSEGCSVDGIVDVGAARFAERFDGQATQANGKFDKLVNSPKGPLVLQEGLAGQNVFLQDTGIQDVGVLLGGIGNEGSTPDGTPKADAAGEGAVSLLFDGDQSKFGFQVYGTSTGASVYLAFFRFDGSLIDLITITDFVSGQGFGFSRDGDVKDIAGVSIWNDRARATEPNPAGGVGFAGLLHDVTDSRDNGGGNVPEPAGLLLVAVALLGAARASARRR